MPRPPASSEHAPPGAEPTRTRRRLILLGLLGFVALSAFHALTGREHWPFSPYAMYSTIKSPEGAVKLVLVAVEPNGREDRLLSSRALAPLNRVKVDSTLARARRADEAAGRGAEASPGSRLRDTFADLCTVLALRHPGAAGFRLYRAEWRLLPDASNLETPEVWELLAEWPSPAAPGRSRP